jgi:glucose/arabinose dehydrogenase
MKSPLSSSSAGQRLGLIAGAAVALAACSPSPEEAPGATELRPWALSVPAGFSGSTVVSGLNDPTAMAFAPDGRLFVCQQGGALRVVAGGQLLPAAFLQLPVDNAGERGLLGVTFDPGFASNRFVYVYYTVRAPNLHNRLSRFRASASNPNLVESGSETVLLEMDPLSGASNHNGGAVHFGPDGKLYVAVGDNARGSNAQTLGNLLGKMLRLNADGGIPADNPFFAQASGRNRAIWALGLRNPFTFAFLTQPGSSRMFINDVGLGSFEEIDQGVAGANYGWPAVEGPSSDPRYRAPVHAYGHDNNQCAIAGGAFYTPARPSFPADYLGDYLFADYCAGWVKRLDPSSGAVTTLATGLSSPVDVDVGDDGSVYVLSRGSGRVERIAASGPTGSAPRITVQPADAEALVGQAVSFTVEATGSGPLRYQWQRDGANIVGATAAVLQLGGLRVEDDGALFRVVIANAFGQAISDQALLEVSQGTAPVGAIIGPAAGVRYRAGQPIHYAAVATDEEDGSLPPSAFTFWVDLHHDQHTHPARPPISGAATGSFLVPDEGEVSAAVFYRIHLRVQDSAGLEHHSWVDVLPMVATVTLASDPPGLALELDGAAVVAPSSFQGVAGIVRQIAAPSPQSRQQRTWRFVSWSDGGAAAHALSTPATDTTLVAVFSADALPPPPPPPPVIWEAEDALLSGVRTAGEHPGFTGRSFVDYLQASGDFVEWTVEVPTAGNYHLELRYANSGSSLRPLEIRINGTLLATRAQFPRTSSWQDWQTIRLPVVLPAGRSRIRATAAGSSGPNLDHLRLVPR